MISSRIEILGYAQDNVPLPMHGVRRWESDAGRYYELRVDVDMLGDLTLTTINGGLGSRLGMMRVVAIGEDVMPAVAAIEKRRLARSYVEIGRA